MKHRGKVVALSTVAIGLGILVTAGIVSKDRVLEEWQFRKVKTERVGKKVCTIMPRSPEFKNKSADVAAGDFEFLEFCRFIADYTARPIVCYYKDRGFNRIITILSPIYGCTAETAIGILKANHFFISWEYLHGSGLCCVVEQPVELEQPAAEPCCH